MSTRILKALPGKLDIKRHSPSILYLPAHEILVCIAYLSSYGSDESIQSHILLSAFATCMPKVRKYIESPIKYLNFSSTGYRSTKTFEA